MRCSICNEEGVELIVNYAQYLMTQQIEQDHFASGEHGNFLLLSAPINIKCAVKNKTLNQQ
jgi:hypothetical protein